MKQYWLILYPDTFLWTKNEKGLLYNTVTFAKLPFENKGELAKITETLLEIDNLYRATLSDTLLEIEEVKAWVDQVIATNSGALVIDDGVNKRPVSLKPKLKVQDGLEYYKWEHSRGIDGNVIQNLHQLIFHINGSKKGNTEYAKQFIYPTETVCSLDKEMLMQFIRNARKSDFLTEIALVGDIANYPDFCELTDLIKTLNYAITLYCIDSDFLAYSKHVSELDEEGVSYRLLISDYTLLEELAKYKNVEAITYVFIITSEEDYHLALNSIEAYNLERITILPAYTSSNLSFFEENVYLSEEEIKEIELSKQDVYIRQALNLFSFGNLTIKADGEIYANLNDPAIGDISDTPHKVVYNEMTAGQSWLRTRSQKPCCDCIYQWICPSPSSYELLIGKQNLCSFKPESL